MHCLGRIWRRTNKAMLMYGAYHAGGSKFNWEIEQQWTKPNKKLRGKELGKTSVEDVDNPLGGFPNHEEGFQHIAYHAMQSMYEILSNCTTGGNYWKVEAPLECSHIPDWQDIVAYNSASAAASEQERFKTIREEQADFNAHIMKLPSFIQYRMCTGNRLVHKHKSFKKHRNLVALLTEHNVKLM